VQTKTACPHCGAENYATDTQCMECGTALAAGAKTPPGAAKPVSARRPPLVQRPSQDEAPDGKPGFVDTIAPCRIGLAIGALCAVVPLYFIANAIAFEKLSRTSLQPTTIHALIAFACLAMAVYGAWVHYGFAEIEEKHTAWRWYVLFLATGLLGAVVMLIMGMIGGGIEYLVVGRKRGGPMRGKR